MQSVKCVIVGDNAVGKTYLLYTYINKVFPKDYIPGFFDTYSKEVSIDNHSISLTLWDTAGSEDYEQFRMLLYPQVNIVIICFSIASPTSYENVERKWNPEVKRCCPDVPILLVGTKSDLRVDQDLLEKLKEQNETTLTQQQGTMMARQIKAAKYVECAAINQEGLNEVFDEAVLVFLKHSTKKHCVLS